MAILGYTCLDVNEKAVAVPLRIFLRDQMGIQKLIGIGTPVRSNAYGIGIDARRSAMGYMGFPVCFPNFLLRCEFYFKWNIYLFHVKRFII